MYDAVISSSNCFFNFKNQKSVFRQVIMPNPETPHQDGTVEDKLTEFDSSDDEESCAGEALVKEESNLGNMQLLEMSIFLWAQHPDFVGLFGLLP